MHSLNQCFNRGKTPACKQNGTLHLPQKSNSMAITQVFESVMKKSTV